VFDLFEHLFEAEALSESLAPGATIFRGAATSKAKSLVAAVMRVTEQAPFRHMITPGGYRMSVAMTNCGQVGWVTDQAGYRYEASDPMRGQHWPVMPVEFLELASDSATKAGFTNFLPDSCLINRYEPGARLSLHQDRNERDFGAPIVSVSLGLPAVFLFGGLRRSDRARRIRLVHGDIVVWGGLARLRYHGVMPLQDGWQPGLGQCRLNLTFRRAL
jgi:alkylated DNA repair protein (DNA oxidative demethylase)